MDNLKSCKICKKSFVKPEHSANGLTSHIKKNHPEISLEDYFLKYIGVKGICLFCSKETRFISIFKKYSNFCSISCSNNYRSKNKLYSKKLDKVTVNNMYKSGMLIKDIANFFDVKSETVSNLIDAKLDMSSIRKKTLNSEFNKFIEKNKENIIKTHTEYINGSLSNFKQIAEKIGCSDRVIKKIFNHLNLRLKTKNELNESKSRSLFVSKKKIKIVHDWIDLYNQHLDKKPICLIAEETGISESVIGRRFKELNLMPKRFYRSSGEFKICSILDSFGIKYEETNRSILAGTGFGEIDIFIPEFNIGIEFNGVYYHSSKFKDKNYHQNKTDICLEKGIDLIHIWEGSDWLSVISRLKNKLNIYDRKIFARNLEITNDSNKIIKFFNENHFDGNAGSFYYLGLEENGEIISAISFRKVNNDVCEISRFASLSGCVVIGAFSRLLKNSIKYIKKEGYYEILTYANIDWSSDYKKTVYYKNGFTYIGKTQPKLYFMGKNKLIGRHNFQKHKLKEKYEDYKGQNVLAFLASKKVFPVYTTGNHKFILPI